MATFQAQVTGLTDLSISSSGTNPTEAQLTQFLTDGAKEIINILPPNLLDWCAVQQTFTSVMPGSEAETMNTGKILRVYRNDGDFDRVCRRIRADEKGYANDPDEMGYASVTDPVFYTENNKLNALPEVGSCKYDEVQYPAVAYSDTAIAVFPDEAEYLVSLYGAIKSLQNVLGDKSSNADITTALTAINTELDETQAVCDKIDDDLVLAKVEVVLAKAEAAELATQTDNSSTFNTALAAIATELDKVDDIINLANDEFDEVSTQVSGSKDSPITDAFTELEKSNALLAKGEVDSESAVNDAAAKIVIELDETQAICDEIGAEVDKAKTALSNMATEMALANKEVDDALIEIDEAVGLVDNSSNIQVAVDGMKTAVAKFRADASDPALFGDESTYDTSDSAMTNVKIYVDRAISYVNGDFPAATHDLLLNLADIDAEITNEDIELANIRIQQAQTTMSAMKSDLEIAQIYITEWNTMTDTLVKEINAFSSEANARYGWISAKSTVWNAEIAAAQGYMSIANGYTSQASGFNANAQGYASEVKTKLDIANGYVSEINVRLQQADAKRQESQSRLSAGSAYLQEAQSTISAGNAYLQEAQGRIGQAQGYASEVSARGGFSSAKSQAIQGHISTAQAYVSTAQGFGNEVQSKTGIAQAYSNEVQSRLAVDSAHYGWYEKQQAKLQADYEGGIQKLLGGYKD
jgi:hypothetical protein